jgi:hypothetical protein
VQSGVLQVSAINTEGDAVSVYNLDQPLPSYFEIQATMNAGKPIAGWKANAFLIFDYQNPHDFKFAGINVFLNKLQMGHRTATGWVVDVQSNIQAKPDTYYNMLVAVNGTVVTLKVDNTVALTYTFAPRVIDGRQMGLNWGMVGVGSNQARGLFDNIQAQKLAPVSTMDETEDFSDGYANRFAGGKLGTWTVTAGGRYDANLPAGDDKGFSLMDLGIGRGIAPASFLELTAKLNTQGMGGIIFDQYSANDFKFVVIDAPGDRVMLGHRTQNKGWVIDAVTSRTIDAGVDYTLQVTLKGTTASVMLDGQTVLGYAYNGVAVDGRFGLLTRAGRSSFDSFRLRTDDPACQDLPLPEPGGNPPRQMSGAESAALAPSTSTTSSSLQAASTVVVVDATGTSAPQTDWVYVTATRDEQRKDSKPATQASAAAESAESARATFAAALWEDWLVVRKDVRK